MMENFLAFSADVTAFNIVELQGTGLAQAYLDTVTGVVGAELLNELLDTYEKLRHEDQETKEFRLHREIFGDEKLGPIARNIIKMWYLGLWFELPRIWTQTFGALQKNVSFAVSAASYTEGLLWPAIGANPPGAKAPGYASWALPPEIPAV